MDRLHSNKSRGAARYLRLLTVISVAAFTLSACSQTKGFLSRVGDSSSFGGNDPVLGAPAAEDYLQELQKISVDDPAAQAEIYADARAAAQLTPSPSTELRYALVLATSGHPETNFGEAQRVLREVLSQSELLSASEIALATIYLNTVENQLLLQAESRRMSSTSTQAARVQEAALNERLLRAEADNERLRRQLADAEDKLEAITSIERSIREQDNKQ